MGVLSKLGFQRNWIYEVIVSSSCGELINHAPMGVWTSDFNNIKLKVYSNSLTLGNLLENPLLTVSFPDSIKVFNDVLFNKDFTTKKYSSIDLKIVRKKKVDGGIEFTCKIVKSKLKRNTRLFNRAESLALEYLILKTKPGVKKKDLNELRRVVNKVAPKSIYSKIVGK